MPKITFVQPCGTEISAEGAAGLSVMEFAVTNMVDGITADCGGACSCATCHVVVDPVWFAKTGGPGDGESDLLDFADGVGETSRLGCQIEVTAELDGMVVTIPQS